MIFLPFVYLCMQLQRKKARNSAIIFRFQSHWISCMLSVLCRYRFICWWIFMSNTLTYRKLNRILICILYHLVYFMFWFYFKRTIVLAMVWQLFINVSQESLNKKQKFYTYTVYCNYTLPYILYVWFRLCGSFLSIMIWLKYCLFLFCQKKISYFPNISKLGVHPIHFAF